ncbi:hypothetical protein MOF47_04030 [Bacillus spizizenii]|nr:hypothetical protein [Bacillus spizizenii]
MDYPLNEQTFEQIIPYDERQPYYSRPRPPFYPPYYYPRPFYPFYPRPPYYYPRPRPAVRISIPFKRVAFKRRQRFGHSVCERKIV